MAEEEAAAAAEAEAQAVADAEAEAARLAEEEAAAAAEDEARVIADAEAALLAEEAAVEAEAQALAAAEAEAARLAEEEAAAAAEAEARAIADAEAALLTEEAAVEAEAQAIAAAEAEAARLAEEEAAEAEAVRLAEEEAAAAAEAEAQATAAETEAARLAEEEAAAAAAAEAQAIAAAEAEAARLAEEEAAEAEAVRLAEEEAAEAGEAEAQATAAAEAEAKRLAEERSAATEAESQAIAAAEAEASAAEASVKITLVDPTVEEVFEVPAAAAPNAAAAPQEVVEESLTARSVRTSEQEFATTIERAAAPAAQDGGLTSIEKALLLGLGAVVVGSVLRNGDRVVANSGDRVIVEGADGLTVYKDDDALLRQPGVTMRTEVFADGSSRTTHDREDGAQVVTIRDARGRVLRRSVVYSDGPRYELFNDLEPEPAVDQRFLEKTRPEPRSLSAADSDLAALRAALRQDMSFDAGRTFSLRQIREIEQVRSLVPAIELDTVTFPSGSAAIPPAQVRRLLRLGILIEEMLLENPREMFLIEGHTDGVGNGSQNLALSDRRAESVALALTENFRIFPENLIVQGYGEAFPRVQTQTAEERNRRVTARRITPLLREIAEN